MYACHVPFLISIFFHSGNLQQSKIIVNMFVSFQPTNYSNPVYAKLYMDGQNCRNSLASMDERKELLPKKIDIGIRETVA